MAIALVLGAVLISSAAPAEAKRVEFDPVRFFSGRTHGDGSLKVILSSRRRIHVTGLGRVAEDGTLTIDQTVVDGSKPAKHRHWRLRRIDRQNWGGTLSDATAPVKVRLNGATMTIAYPMKGNMQVRQTLTMDVDGQAVMNRMTIRKLGVTVATLEETIVKVAD